MSTKLESAVKRSVQILEIVCSILLSLVCFIVLVQVVARFILKYPTPWSEELARFLLVILVFLGSSVSLKEKTHLIALDIFSGRSERVENLGRILTDIIILVVSLMYLRNSIRMAVIAGTEMASSMLWLKIRYLYTIIAVGFFFSALYSLLHILETFFSMKKGEKQ